MSLLRLLTVPRLTASFPTTRLVQKVSNTLFRLRVTRPPGGLKAHVLTSAELQTTASGPALAQISQCAQYHWTQGIDELPGADLQISST